MEKNYWQIDDNLYKVHMSSDVYMEIKEDELKKVLKRLEEFDC